MNEFVKEVTGTLFVLSSIVCILILQSFLAEKRIILIFNNVSTS